MANTDEFSGIARGIMGGSQGHDAFPSDLSITQSTSCHPGDEYFSKTKRSAIKLALSLYKSQKASGVKCPHKVFGNTEQ